MKHIALIILTVLTVPFAVRADYDADAAERKADLYFMEALRMRDQGKLDAHYSLMARAYELTPHKTGREAYEVGVRNLYFAAQHRDSLMYASALSMIEDYFNANQTDVYAGVYLSNLYSHQGQISEAIAVYETLEKYHPKNTTLVGNHADLLVRDNKLDEAVMLYKRLEKSMGKSTTITQRICNVRIWQGDTLGAFAEIDSLIAAQPRSVDALQLGASAATEFGMPEKALQYIEQAKTLDPTNGTTYYYAANAYQVLGREKEYDEAIRGALMGEDLELGSKISLLRYYINTRVNEDEFAEVLSPIFEALISQYSHDYQVRVIYSSFFFDQERWEEAAEQMEHALDIESKSPDDYTTLARIYVISGNNDKAIDALERGIKQYPDAMPIHHLQAGIYMENEDFLKAAEKLETMLVDETLTDMYRSEIYTSLGDVYQQIENKQEQVITYYEKALELDRTNDMAMNNYAYYLSTHDGDLLKAKELISRAILFNPGSATYYDTFAWVMFRLGDLQEAKRYIDLAILSADQESDDAAQISDEILEHAAEIYNAIGQKDKAQEYRNRIINTNP